MITLFSGPKPFAGHVGVIQDNAVGSWKRLGKDVQVILIGDEPGIREAAGRHNVLHLADTPRTPSGTPRLDSMFAMARETAKHPWLCYVNADVILMPDLLPGIAEVAGRFASFLIVGQRWDLELHERLEFEADWESRLRHEVALRGRRHPPGGSDYFVFPHGCFQTLPPFALGRAGWDNWMIYHARHRRWPVVDASESVTVIHQDHDYAHLPGGQPHYRLPESERNLEMGGGRPSVFTLQDSDWWLAKGRVRRRPLQLRLLPRRVEASIYLALGPGKAARRARLLLHPRETLRSLMGRPREERGRS